MPTSEYNDLEVKQLLKGNNLLKWIIIVFLISFILQFLLSVLIIISESELYFGYKSYKKTNIIINSLDRLNTRGTADNKAILVRGITEDNKEVFFFPFKQRDRAYIDDYFNSDESFTGRVDALVSSNYSKIYFSEKHLEPLTFSNLWKSRIVDISCTTILYILIKVMIFYDNKLLKKYGLNSKLYNKLRDEDKLRDYLHQFNKE